MQAALLIALAAVTAEGDEPVLELASDRPGFSYATGTTPAGRWTTELGFRGVFGDDTTFDLPVAAVRLGLASFLELQVGLPAVTYAPGGPDGLGDILLGAKVGHAPTDWTSYSFVGLISLPVGDDGFGDESWQVIGSGNLELYFLTGGWVALNAQVDTFTGEDGDNEVAVTPSFAFGWTLFDATNPFVQTFVRFSDGQTSPFFGGGIAHLITPRLQVDVSMDYDVDASAAVVETGVAVLW